ncbi:hypothetical protein ACFYXF_00495 [Streptomyces sp. NPDC002680]|uniref:hypothetical protein n=1 Tax=Streptomyces sp. NPDC002680 TaxID=3364659 RepID=UPI00368A1709
MAQFGGHLATGFVDVTGAPSALDSEGFRDVRQIEDRRVPTTSWRGPRPPTRSTRPTSAGCCPPRSRRMPM